jgi:hypothetical protein
MEALVIARLSQRARMRLWQVYCLSWNVVRRNLFLSGSWDDSIKLWDLARPASLATFREHTYCVYAANWRACLPWQRSLHLLGLVLGLGRERTGSAGLLTSVEQGGMCRLRAGTRRTRTSL